MLALIETSVGHRTHELVLANIRLLQRAFQSFTPQFELRLWDGSVHLMGEGNAAKSFTLVCHNPQMFSQMVLSHDRLCLAEAYFKGDLDVEGDFFATLGLKDQLYAIRPTLLERLGAMVNALRIEDSATTRSTSNCAVGYYSVWID